MVKKKVYYFWKAKNIQKFVTRVYYDNNHIKRTMITFLGLPVYINDEVVEIKRESKSRL